MASSVAPAQIRDTTIAGAPAATDLKSVLFRVAAVLAVASGVIHLAVVRHHLDDAVVTAGFALMGGAQLVVGVGLITRPASRARLAGLLHAGIVATWVLSRTVGLVVVPGAEERASFGFADTIANMFSLGVIAALATIDRTDRRSARHPLSARVARGVLVAVGVAAVAVAAPAALAPHQHAGHDHPATGEPASGHDHAPTDDGHDDPAHDHG
jgi:hypothetical protein